MTDVLLNSSQEEVERRKKLQSGDAPSVLPDRGVIITVDTETDDAVSSNSSSTRAPKEFDSLMEEFFGETILLDGGKVDAGVLTIFVVIVSLIAVCFLLLFDIVMISLSRYLNVCGRCFTLTGKLKNDTSPLMKQWKEMKKRKEQEELEMQQFSLNTDGDDEGSGDEEEGGSGDGSSSTSQRGARRRRGILKRPSIWKRRKSRALTSIEEDSSSISMASMDDVRFASHIVNENVNFEEDEEGVPRYPPYYYPPGTQGWTTIPLDRVKVEVETPSAVPPAVVQVNEEKPAVVQVTEKKPKKKVKFV